MFKGCIKTIIEFAWIISSVAAFRNTSCRNAEACLHEKLFANYNHFVRPVESTSTVTNVNVSLIMNSLSDMDDKGEIMKIVGYFRAVWIDEFLRWDPDEHSTNWLIVPARKIWIPDLFLANSAKKFFYRSFKDVLLAVYYTGEVFWEFGGVLPSRCYFDITYYPFDQQTCNVEIGVWTYLFFEVDLNVIEVEDSNYHNNSLWTYVKYTTSYKKIHEHYARAIFSLTWSRKPQYYLFNVLIPTSCLMCVALGVFWIPPDCGEKSSLGITILLGFSVLQIVITENTPVNSDVIPQLNKLLMTFMTMSTISLIGAMVSNYLNYKHTETRVPRLIRLVAFRGLACILFLTKEVPRAKNKKFVDEESTINHKESVIKPKIAPETEKSTDTRYIREVVLELRKITNRISEQDKGDFILAEWRFLAKIVDRVLFWMSVIIILVILGTIYL